ncbi:ABC transporter permease subunit [Kerstersia similis]|uniref:ABC transporter permease subunit n=1 Tax=Kerstersia similis TaxID=206505 RepID=UPI0039F092BE
MKPNPWLRALSFVLGFGFLYLPLLTLVVFSFNASEMVTKWSGFSLRWYRELLNDDVLLSAAWLSLRVAAMTATMAVIIGTWAGYVLARMRRFPGISLFVAMISAPLVIPEVILGISLLLMFVELHNLTGWPEGQGVFTIWVGHVVLATAYVAVIIQSRLREFDRSLEEAALDLGATPLTVFFRITLPLIAPALAAGWLLAFTLSLDDVVIASFLSGPGSTLLSPEIFARVRLGLKPEVNALATIFIVAVGICVLIAYRLQKRKEIAS